MLMLIPPSTQGLAHLKLNPEQKANGETEAENGISNHVQSHIALLLPHGGGWE